MYLCIHRYLYCKIQCISHKYKKYYKIKKTLLNIVEIKIQFIQNRSIKVFVDVNFSSKRLQC